MDYEENESKIKEAFKYYYSDKLLDSKRRQTGLVNIDEIMFAAFTLGYMHNERRENEKKTKTKE